ncbi:MAG: TM2 domain-containing protein [Ilumatobacteraceae bacterium]|jgi:TM2 domain-containing membrane protein YozV|nr:TM2 domain-containing protein [Ilumatobacteraceae bacterium]
MSDPFSMPVPPPPGGGNKKEKVAAGLLAIFLGGLGIHKFYLGGKQQKTAGIIMLVVWVVGFCLFFVGPIVIGIIAFIEGIIYLTKDDAEFQATYGDGDKAWF